MHVTTVFNKLLALQGAFVRGVAFGPTGIVVDVAKRHRRNRCPRCTFSSPRFESDKPPLQLDKANEVRDRLAAGKVRYRAVLLHR